MWGIAKDKKIQDQNLSKSSDSKFWYSSKLMALCVPVGKECCGVVVWWYGGVPGVWVSVSWEDQDLKQRQVNGRGSGSETAAS